MIYNIGSSNINFKFMAESLICLSYLLENYLKLRQFLKCEKKVVSDSIKAIKEINFDQKIYEKS